MTPNLTMLVAMDQERNIGKDNQLPWRLPSDLKWFKEVTQGGVVIMGRKTFESIGKPLPDRINIVLSRQPIPTALINQVIWVSNAMRVLEICEQYLTQYADRLFVIGGGDIYQQFLPYTTKVITTDVQTVVEGDTKFPLLNPIAWTATLGEQNIEPNVKDQFVYTRTHWERKPLTRRFRIFDSKDYSRTRDLPVEQVEWIVNRYVKSSMPRFQNITSDIDANAYARLFDIPLIEAINLLPAGLDLPMSGHFYDLVVVVLADRVVIDASLQIHQAPVRKDFTITFVPAFTPIPSAVPQLKLAKIDVLLFKEPLE